MLMNNCKDKRQNIILRNYHHILIYSKQTSSSACIQEYMIFSLRARIIWKFAHQIEHNEWDVCIVIKLTGLWRENSKVFISLNFILQKMHSAITQFIDWHTQKERSWPNPTSNLCITVINFVAEREQ